MSHIVTIKTEVRDPQAVAAACRRLGLPEPVTGTATLFSGEATGLLVQAARLALPRRARHGHRADPLRQLRRRWGKQEHLDRFLQLYAVEKARIEARKRGHNVVELALPDGSIKLTIQVGGAA